MNLASLLSDIGGRCILDINILLSTMPLNALSVRRFRKR